MRGSTATWLILLAALVAVGSSIWAGEEYGGAALLPGLIGNFGASLLAFMLALSWERSRERKQAATDAERSRHEDEKTASDLQARRATEVRRRLEPIREELRRNRASLDDLSTGLADDPNIRVLHPELLDGAWSSNAPRLSELVADYDFIADLSSTFGRIEELRWRLRQRTATIAVMAGSDVARGLEQALRNMTRPLVTELLEEVDDLLKRVGAQIDDPQVQPLGLLHTDSATGTIRIYGSGGDFVSGP